MKCSWVRKSGSSSLVVFYTGWGMSAESVNIDTYEHDLLVFSDYREIDIPVETRKELVAYKTIYVLAWSLGVVAAASNKTCFKPSKMIAINGSLFPANDKYGIPEAIYFGTYESLDKENLGKFYRRMFVCKEQHQRFILEQKHEPNILELKEELLAIKELSVNLKQEDKTCFDKVFLSRKDKVFPLSNLTSLWDKFVLLDFGHYPFYDFKDWSDIFVR